MITFIVRSNNDLDTISPIVFKLLSLGREAAIISQNPFLDIRRDARIDYLGGIGGSRLICGYWHEKGPRRWASRLWSWIISTAFSEGLGQTIKKAGGGTIGLSILPVLLRLGMSKILYRSRLGRHIDSRIYTIAWFESMYLLLGSKVTVFDFVDNDAYFTRRLIAAARAQGVSVVEIAHGPDIFFNRPKEDIGQFIARSDHMILPHRYLADLYDHERHRSRMHILGAPRYDRDWVARILDHIQEPLPPRSGGKLHLLYLERGALVGQEYVEANLETFMMLKDRGDVTIIVKPHPRDNLSRFLPVGYAHENLRVEKALSTPTLVKWADVVIGTASGSLIEAIVQKKPLISARFLHRDETLIDKYGAAFIVHNQEELLLLLEDLRRGRGVDSGMEANIRRFLRDVVHAGREDGDVLGRYSEFLIGLAQDGAHRTTLSSESKATN